MLASLCIGMSSLCLSRWRHLGAQCLRAGRSCGLAASLQQWDVSYTSYTTVMHSAAGIATSVQLHTP